MAGGFKHVLDDDDNYIGVDLLENMGDMEEAIEEMAFMILTLRQRWGGPQIVDDLSKRYFQCCRGEEPWPSFMKVHS
jgi:hypothetical protein